MLLTHSFLLCSSALPIFPEPDVRTKMVKFKHETLRLLTCSKMMRKNMELSHTSYHGHMVNVRRFCYFSDQSESSIHQHCAFPSSRLPLHHLFSLSIFPAVHHTPLFFSFISSHLCSLHHSFSSFCFFQSRLLSTACSPSLCLLFFSLPFPLSLKPLPEF